MVQCSIKASPTFGIRPHPADSGPAKTQPMQYGFSLPVRGNLATHDGIVGIARHGERPCFASATIADPIVFPTSVESKYPYDASGNHPSTGDAIEPLTLMAFAAGRTSTLRFITSVLILPHRNPVLAAKMIATIDVLSQGRVTLDIGVGWPREEFEARAPPIWVGGHSKAALRRTARHADGWHPIGTVATAEPRPPEFSAMLDDLKRMTDAEGRDYADITIAFVARLHETPQPVIAADRMPFSGSAKQLIDAVEAYRKLGVSHLSLDVRDATLGQTLDRMDWFAREVRPHTG